MWDRIASAYILLLGLYCLTPRAGRQQEAWNRWFRSKFPFVNKIPGAESLYSAASQLVLRWMVGLGFCVSGILGLLGVVRYGFD